MRQTSPDQRMKALDGLRGLAILLVFLRHTQINSVIMPPFLRSFIFNGGSLGVTILFCLSGFLMAYLYPTPQEKAVFLQRRYTRIFPLYIGICLTMLAIKILPGGLWIEALCLIIIPLFLHLIWIHIIKPRTAEFKRLMFFTFFCLQVITSIGYFLTSQHPSVLNYTSLPKLIQAIIVVLVNTTLAFPVGNYVSMLIGVSWSLTAEVLFYLMYPFICAPVIAYLAPQRRWLKILFLISLLALVSGIGRLSEQFWSLTLFQPFYFYNFVGGMTLGYIYRKYRPRFAAVYASHPRLVDASAILLLFGCALWENFDFSVPFISAQFKIILIAIPVTFLVAVSLMHKSMFARTLSSKFLVYSGTVSYSIYLTHPLVLGAIADIFGAPLTIFELIRFILVGYVIQIVFATVLYILLEKPYFLKPHRHKKVSLSVPAYNPKPNALVVCSVICIIYMMASVFAYRYKLRYDTLQDPFLKITKIYPVAVLREAPSNEEKRSLLLLLPFGLTTAYLLLLRKGYISTPV